MKKARRESGIRGRIECVRVWILVRFLMDALSVGVSACHGDCVCVGLVGFKMYPL